VGRSRGRRSGGTDPAEASRAVTAFGQDNDVRRKKRRPALPPHLKDEQILDFLRGIGIETRETALFDRRDRAAAGNAKPAVTVDTPYTGLASHDEKAQEMDGEEVQPYHMPPPCSIQSVGSGAVAGKAVGGDRQTRSALAALRPAPQHVAVGPTPGTRASTATNTDMTCRSPTSSRWRKRLGTRQRTLVNFRCGSLATVG